MAHWQRVMGGEREHERTDMDGTCSRSLAQAGDVFARELLPRRRNRGRMAWSVTKRSWEAVRLSSSSTSELRNHDDKAGISTLH